MSISQPEQCRETLAKTGFLYLSVSIGWALFGAGYEYFSHEVYSPFMIYAFLFPLAGGALPYGFLSLFFRGRLPGRLSRSLYNSGIAALTVGSVMQGALDIYGTTNRLMLVYWLAGAAFALSGVLCHAVCGGLARRAHPAP